MSPFAGAAGARARNPARHAYALRRPVLNPYLVRQRDRRRARELLLVLGVSLVLGSCLLVYVGLHVKLLHAGYTVEALEGRLLEVERRERQLRLDVSYLERPAHIERRAAAELGMGAPTLEQLVFEEELE